jgi:hypothetical protein
MQKQDLPAGCGRGLVLVDEDGGVIIDLVQTALCGEQIDVDLPGPEIARNGEQMRVIDDWVKGPRQISS